LLHHEKLAFLKFFITYFVSVALLIILVGYFYFSQVKAHYLKAEEFSLIEYARRIKMNDGVVEYPKDFKHNFVTKPNEHINISNFTIKEDEFSKFVPMNKKFYYLEVHKSTRYFKNKLYNLKKIIISIQIILLLIFAFISYKLAKSALKPLQESISKLDKFAKDLIHDLNTPVTSMKLNIKLIEKTPDIQQNKALLRLKQSVNDISELHESLTVLLQEETFQTQHINLCEMLHDIVQTYKQIYTNLTFDLECKNFKVKVNKSAIKQILQNIISNASKYNSQDGFVKIYTKDNALYIQDNGNGIKNPNKIFERSYSEKHSSGIGLDIVKRLAFAMDIKIDVKTSKNGSTFILIF
jgi:two-component system OmpR family sensor kinase